jgi:flagellar M-ring protein FliF
VVETLRNLGTTRLIVTAGVVVTLLGLFFFLATRLTTPTMALLYSDLSMADSGRIVQKLEAMQVPHELAGNGSSILVPADQVARLRMAIAQEGLPSGGNMGYEIFDRSESLGTSSFVLNINHLRALEGELARTIGSLNYVKSARVHLALPKRELFTRDQQDPTASVVLQMNGGRRIDKGEIQAIQNLVAAAVPRLKPNHISIVDGQGTLLARAREDGTGVEGSGTSTEEIKSTYEARAARTIEEMLERVVGPGRVRAEVNADMDFDRISTTSETFDPDGQVVRSTQNVEETSKSRDADTQNNTVSVASNIPAPLSQGNPPAPSSTPGASSQSNRTEETVNYEISRTTKTHVRESGVVKRITVAVVVDGTYGEAGSDGQRTYKPRSAEELDQLSKLVKSAVGYDETRGDKVELVNLRFNQGADLMDDPARPLFGLDKNDYIRIAELATIGIVAILVILLVVRPLMKRLLESIPNAIASSKNLLEESVAAARPALPPAIGTAALVAAAGGGLGGNALSEASIDIDQVEGRVRESSLKKISEIVDKHPDEAVNIIRNWMYREN